MISRRPSALRWALIAVAALVAAGVSGAVTLEVLLRLTARGWSRAALGRWQERQPWEAIRRDGPDGLPHPVPGGRASWRVQPWREAIEYRLDDHGFRSGGPIPTAPSPCRILALGDSHTFGYGVGAEQAWPSVVASMLSRVTIANAGLCGSGIAAEQAWLGDAMVAAHPGVVILAVTPWSLREDPDAPAPYDLDPARPRIGAYLARLTRYSAVADWTSRLVFQHLTPLTGWPPPAPVLWELAPLLEPVAAFHARWRGVHAHLARMVAAVRARGAQPILLFIPLDLQVSRGRNVLYRAGWLPYRTNGFVDRDYTRDDRYGHALAKTAARLRVAFFDVTPVLRAGGLESFLEDDYHLAPLGHARIAALMAPALASACAQMPAATWIRTPAPAIRPDEAPPGPRAAAAADAPGGAAGRAPLRASRGA